MLLPACTILLAVLLATVLKINIASAEKIKFPDRLDFPNQDPVADGTDRNLSEDSSSSQRKMEIPLDMIQKLNQITDADEFFKEFVKEEKKTYSAGIGGNLYGFASKLRASPLLAARTGTIGDDASGSTAAGSASEPVERNSGVLRPRPASCMPELTTVRLYEPEDRTIFSFPSCTRIERCGGCCLHELLSCQPVTTEIINYEVVITQYLGENNLGYTGKEIVPVEKHTKCKCDCIVKASDCTPLQVYNENECRCTCTNLDEKEKCRQDSENKLWVPHTCLCECRNTMECSTGHFFSTLTCQCELIKETQVRIASRDRHDYNFYKVLPDYRSQQRRTPLLK